MSMSRRLQELRQKEQLSQEELAERIGVSRQAISKWESEQSSPDIENIVRLSEIFNTSTDYILKGTQPTVIKTPEKSELIRQHKAQNRQYLVISSITSVLAITVVIILGQYIAFPDGDGFGENMFLSNTFTVCGILIVIATAIILNFRRRQKSASHSD